MIHGTLNELYVDSLIAKHFSETGIGSQAVSALQLTPVIVLSDAIDCLNKPVQFEITFKDFKQFICQFQSILYKIAAAPLPMITVNGVPEITYQTNPISLSFLYALVNVLKTNKRQYFRMFRRTIAQTNYSRLLNVNEIRLNILIKNRGS